VALALFVCAASAGGTSCSPAWTRASLPNDGAGASLYATAALGPSDVWAVGSYYDGVSDSALAQHWNGAQWNTSAMPAVGRAAYLTAVAALSAADVWSVGWWTDNAGATHTLALHWDGAAWHVVATPSPGSIANYLAAVTTLSPGDVWAVGYQVTSAAVYQTLALHWNGTSWSLVPTPNAGAQDNLLEGVSASSADDVWAAGFFAADGSSTSTLTAHWNGSAWSRVASPNPGAQANSLNAVHVRTRDDAWAVGTYHDGRNNVSLTMRWDGAQWRIVASPNIAESGNVLNDVHADAPGDAWAVGYYYNTVGDRVQETLTLHWDGALWTLLPSPNASPASNYLQGVASLPDGEVWTVGLSPTGSIVQRLCAVQTLASGFTPRTATIPRGEAAVWIVPADELEDHDIADATGMALYDSGPRGAGTSFSYRFTAAGGYRVRDTSNASAGTIRVPMQVTPASGGVQTRFTVVWSAESAAPGFAFDVQILRPGAPEFVDWRSGATSAAARFVPDAGAGSYAFRARLRELADGQHSAWSPRVSIQAS